MKSFFSIIAVFLIGIVISFGLCACGNQETSEQESNVANPYHECTYDELLEATGVDINAPEGAKDVAFAYIDSEESPVAQVTFTLDGKEFCYRAQSTGITSLSGSDATDNQEASVENLKTAAKNSIITGESLSGMNGKWECSAAVDVAENREGICAFNDGDEGFICWLDVVPGILYTLSMDDGCSQQMLVDMAEKIFVPVQGDVG